MQNEIRPSDRPTFEGFGQVRFLADELNDFNDAAALVDLMDLVITVDTSIAHLADAMGKPVWILLPRCLDWRWMLDREDSLWRPSARLFRQRPAAGWAGPAGGAR